MPVKPILSAFMMLLCCQGAAAAGFCDGVPPDAPVVRLVGVDKAGDPVLGDGRTLRLVGLAPRQDADEAARFANGIADWRERDLKLVTRGTPDRWGRLPAQLFAIAGSPDIQPQDIAVALAGNGAARSLPEAAQAECSAPAKVARRTPAPKPIQPQAALNPGNVVDGHDIAALKAQAGRVVAIEGRVASVGERAQRTYLNFSRRRAEAASIVLSRKLWRELQAAGWTAGGLSGKRIRARGVLSGQDGLLLDATSIAALELID